MFPFLWILSLSLLLSVENFSSHPTASVNQSSPLIASLRMMSPVGSGNFQHTNDACERLMRIFSSPVPAVETNSCRSISVSPAMWIPSTWSNFSSTQKWSINLGASRQHDSWACSVASCCSDAIGCNQFNNIDRHHLQKQITQANPNPNQTGWCFKWHKTIANNFVIRMTKSLKSGLGWTRSLLPPVHLSFCWHFDIQGGSSWLDADGCLEWPCFSHGTTIKSMGFQMVRNGKHLVVIEKIIKFVMTGCCFCKKQPEKIETASWALAHLADGICRLGAVSQTLRQPDDFKQQSQQPMLKREMLWTLVNTMQLTTTLSFWAWFLTLESEDCGQALFKLGCRTLKNGFWENGWA